MISVQKSIYAHWQTNGRALRTTYVENALATFTRSTICYYLLVALSSVLHTSHYLAVEDRQLAIVHAILQSRRTASTICICFGLTG